MLHLASAPLRSRQISGRQSSGTSTNQLLHCSRPTLRAKSSRTPTTHAMASGIPLITLGKSVETGQRIAASLAPAYAVQAVVTDISELRAALDAAAQKPRGLLIGGAFTDEEADEGTNIIKAWDSSVKVVVRVTPGTLEKVGPAGVAGWVKEQLDAADWN